MATAATASASAVPDPTPTASLALLWYRPFDLRTDDHPALLDAASSSTDHLLPIYCLDEARELCPSSSSPAAAAAAAAVPPMGPHRLRFRLEALADLRESLAALGSDLVVRSGAPEEVLPRVLEEIVEASGGPVAGAAAGAVSLVFHRRPPFSPLLPGDDKPEDDQEAEELRVAEAVARACERLGLGPPCVRRHWGAATLHHPLKEVAAWLSSAGGEAPPPAPASKTPLVSDAEEADAGAEQQLLEALLPDTFSAYRRALEAGAAGGGGGGNSTQTKPKHHLPPLRSWLPSSKPLPAPTSPLPPLPAPFCNHSDEDNNSLPDDTHALFSRAGPRALGALDELSRLCGVDFGPGAVVPAYACDGRGKDEHKDGGIRHPRADPRSAFPFVGGERAARARLAFVLENVLQRPSSSSSSSGPISYGDARMMAAGADSAKLSPYLSAGCLSPRRVAAELALRRGGADDGDEDARWLLSHLVIRDWYVLSGWREAIRARRTRRRAGGGKGDGDGRRPAEVARPFEAWARGRSGASPFVDAAMRELAATGWQSNRSRQVAASALAHDLLPPKRAEGEGGGSGSGQGGWGSDWALGACLFESLLIDADPSANRGNWRSVSARRFDPESQRAKYDPDGLLERAWL